MLKRTLTGACLVAVVTGFFFLRNIDVRLFYILIFIFLALGSFEMINANKSATTVLQKTAVFLFAIGLVPMYYYFNSTGIFALLLFITVVQLFILVFDKNASLEGLGYSLISTLYPSLLLSTMLFINDFGETSLIALLLVFIISPCADTFAYLVGSTFKGKKLCPNISPKKTVSGAIGGLIGGMVGSIVLFFIFKDKITPYLAFSPISVFLLIGLFASAFTELGDLAESVIKRKIGIKDMGKILPGHGGILDRIDGIIIASVFIFAIFQLIII